MIRLSMTYKNRNPYRDAPEIDYDVAVIFIPALFMGSYVGLILSYFLPNIITSIILMVVLISSTNWTLIQGISLWKEETGKAHFYNKSTGYTEEGLYVENDDHIDDNFEKVSLSKNEGSRQRTNLKELDISISTVYESVPPNGGSEIETIIKSESSYIQWNKMRLILATMVVVFLSTMCIGTKDMDSLLNLDSSSLSYKVLYGIYVLYCAFMIKV